jgi:hypothetical protein
MKRNDADEKWLADYDEAERNRRYWSEKIEALNRELLAAEHMFCLAREKLGTLEDNR